MSRLSLGTKHRRRGLVLLSLLFVSGIFLYYRIDRYFPSVTTTEQVNTTRLEELARRDPGDPYLRTKLAEGYLAQRRYNDAITQYQAATKLEEENPTAYLGLGHVYYAQGKYSQAQEAYQKVIEFYQNKPYRRSLRSLNELHYNLAVMYEKEGKLDEATASLEEALAIDGVDADALHLLGVVKLRQGYPEESAKACEEAVRYVPDFREAYETMAAAYGQLGREDLQLYATGMLRYSQKDYGGAARNLEAAAQALPDHEMVQVGLAMAYEKSGQKAKALSVYQAAQRLNPRSFLIKGGIQRLSQP